MKKKIGGHQSHFGDKLSLPNLIIVAVVGLIYF